jgi:hypothetical protein
VGMDGLGMELDIAPVLLQSHRLGRMGKPLPSAERLVPPATDSLFQSPGLRWQLALSPTELSTAHSGKTPGQSSAVGTK